MARILISGASGFIGSHLIPALGVAGHEVRGFDFEMGDIADEKTWEKQSASDILIHLAGRTFVPYSWEKPLEYFNTNLLGTIAALRYCIKSRSRMIFLSSYLYGHAENLPIAETTPLVATNPYALTKKMAEEACSFYADQSDVTVTILRLFNVYGAGQHENFLIPKILRQIASGQGVEVKDLDPKRDYVYIKDVVSAIMRATEIEKGINRFNIGSGKSCSVGELINILKALIGKSAEVRSSGERRQDEIMDTIADVRRSREELGWKPEYSLQEGLKDMIAEELKRGNL